MLIQGIDCTNFYFHLISCPFIVINTLLILLFIGIQYVYDLTGPKKDYYEATKSKVQSLLVDRRRLIVERDTLLKKEFNNVQRIAHEGTYNFCFISIAIRAMRMMIMNDEYTNSTSFSDSIFRCIYSHVHPIQLVWNLNLSIGTIRLLLRLKKRSKKTKIVVKEMQISRFVGIVIFLVHDDNDFHHH